MAWRGGLKAVLDSPGKVAGPPVLSKSAGRLDRWLGVERAEDLRRFLYNLESAQELLFIEDLNLVRSGNIQDQQLTFNIKISTYLRGEHLQSPTP